MKQTITVTGMHCNSCKILISEALEEAGAKNVQVDLDPKKQVGIITFDSTLSKDKVKELVQEQGEYEVA